MYYCLNTKCPPSHHHNVCIATSTLGHTFVWLHVASIQKILCKHLERDTKAI